MVVAMCGPNQTESSCSGARSIFGLGVLMLAACLAGPAVIGAIGALGVGVLVGVGGAIFALALCAAVPAVALAMRRRRSQPSSEVSDFGGA
jgi:hypothetical protein